MTTLRKTRILLASVALAATTFLAPAAAPAEAATSAMTLEQLTGLVTASLNEYWFNYGAFLTRERQHLWTNPNAAFVQHGQWFENACGYGTFGTTAVYCRDDDTIYLNRQIFAGQRARLGDGGMVVILAHEWGHAVQARLHWPSSELQADCFAGLFLGWSETKGYMEAGDLEGALQSAWNAGSFDPGDNHGTPRQRAEATYFGYWWEGQDGWRQTDTTGSCALNY